MRQRNYKNEHYFQKFFLHIWTDLMQMTKLYLGFEHYYWNKLTNLRQSTGINPSLMNNNMSKFYTSVMSQRNFGTNGQHLEYSEQCQQEISS